MIELLKRVTVFMLAGQVILHFLPGEGYEKYAKMVISMMVLAQLAIPVLSVGRFDAEAFFDRTIAEYEEEMERVGEQIQTAGLEERDYVSAGLSEAAEEMLASSAEGLGARLCSVSYSQQEGKLIVHAAKSGSQTEGGEAIRIEKIEVGEAPEKGAEEAPEEGIGEGTEEREEELRGVFAQILGLKEEQVEVIWDE